MYGGKPYAQEYIFQQSRPSKVKKPQPQWSLGYPLNQTMGFLFSRALSLIAIALRKFGSPVFADYMQPKLFQYVVLDRYF